MLYREGRKIAPAPTLRQRLTDWKTTLLEKDEEPELENLSDWRTSPLRRLKIHRASNDRHKSRHEQPVADDREDEVESNEAEASTDDNRTAGKRRWWPRRRKSQPAEATGASDQEEATDQDASAEE